MSAPKDAVAQLEQEMAVLARLLEALNRRRMYPLERSHYLLLLRLAEGPRRIGELSTLLALDTTTVTRQVAAMEVKGLVSRRPDPEDGRSALVVRTEAGADCAEAMRKTRQLRIARLLGGWEADEVARFAASVERFNAALYDRLGRPDEPLPEQIDEPGCHIARANGIRPGA